MLVIGLLVPHPQDAGQVRRRAGKEELGSAGGSTGGHWGSVGESLGVFLEGGNWRSLGVTGGPPWGGH